MSTKNTPDTPTTENASSPDRTRRKKKKKHVVIRNDHKLVRNQHGEMVPAAQFLLEQTLDYTQKSLLQYRQRMDNLIATNQDLQDTCVQQEKDALDVIAALHAESDSKEETIKKIQLEMEASLEKAHAERQVILQDSDRKIQDMNGILLEKEAAFKVMQAEFAVIKDFRKKRQDMIKELDYQKQELADTRQQHMDTITRMEKKFFEEKIRLQKEANRKISELAAEAHKEIYKENIRMAESLRYHVQDSEALAKENQLLVQANRQLMEEKDLHNVIVKEKLSQVKSQAMEIKDLHVKIESMEHALSHVVREFEAEREIIGTLAKKELEKVKKDAFKLREILEAKSLEMKHIKRLAQHVLDQRSDLERFFLEALNHIREQIKKERLEKKKQEILDYNNQVREIMAKKNGPLPSVKSFRPSVHPSTKKFDLNTATIVAESLLKPPLVPPLPKSENMASEGPVDIHELSWEDKEKVLRLLFAKMNGVALTNNEEREENDGQDEYMQNSSYPEQIIDLPMLQSEYDSEVSPSERNTDASKQPIRVSSADHNADEMKSNVETESGIPMSMFSEMSGTSVETTNLSETGVSLTTNYLSGSRRSLLPVSENFLPVIPATPTSNIEKEESSNDIQFSANSNMPVVSERNLSAPSDRSNSKEGSEDMASNEVMYTLTTAYESGSRRSLIPKSENNLPAIPVSPPTESDSEK